LWCGGWQAIFDYQAVFWFEGGWMLGPARHIPPSPGGMDDIRRRQRLVSQAKCRCFLRGRRTSNSNPKKHLDDALIFGKAVGLLNFCILIRVQVCN